MPNIQLFVLAVVISVAWEEITNSNKELIDLSFMHSIDQYFVYLCSVQIKR